MESLVQALKAAGEPSRLRILAILERHELTVGELVEVLRQSQPRVSRHLGVLSQAGLVQRHREGTSAFYRLARDGEHGSLVDSILANIDRAGAEAARDSKRLRMIRETRAEQAEAYFQAIAADWDRMRTRHVPDAAIEAALLDIFDARRVDDLVDLGTGTGRMLELLGPRVRRGTGIDFSRDMLTVARDKLERAGLTNCHVRLGDISHVEAPDGSVDAVVVHHVLHYLDDPDHAIREAARLLRPHGLLVIVDFAPHGLVQLRDEYAHVRLGFDETEIRSWCGDAGFTDITCREFTPTAADESETLTVIIWTATQRADAPATYDLEVAS